MRIQTSFLFCLFLNNSEVILCKRCVLFMTTFDQFFWLIMTEIVSMSTVNGIHNIESKNKISTNGNISGGFLQSQKRNVLYYDKKFVKESQRWKQIHSMFPENWHFNSCSVLKTTKTPVFIFITEILWWILWHNKWRSIFDILKNLCLWQNWKDFDLLLICLLEF